MSLEELREKNKRLVVEQALHLFVENGVENVSIRQVAQSAGLTERSVYRYFNCRADLILDTAFLFWEKVSQWVNSTVAERAHQYATGLEQVEIMLNIYSRLYIEHPECVRFILSVELALYNAGVTASIQARPPGKFDSSDSPMVRALHLGQEDGSIRKDADIKEFYYNAYDAILGTMQRQLLDSTDCDLDSSKRMEHLCKMFIGALQGRV